MWVRRNVEDYTRKNPENAIQNFSLCRKQIPCKSQATFIFLDRRYTKIITGIIAELNPLHTGHLSLITQAKADSEACVVVLSSNFTQRGSPSLTDKFTRTHTALLAGADLVIELPFLFACAAGHDFARGAVNLLAHFADRIAFGMETPDFDVSKVIQAEGTLEFSAAIRAELGRGASYAKAHALALEALIPEAGAFISQPNNMLAVSYMREIMRYDWPSAALAHGLDVLKVKREGSFSSRAIREDLAGNSWMMPEFSRRVLAESEVSDESRLWPLVQGVLLRSRAEELRKVWGVDEGIEGLFLKHWREACGLEDFIGRCVCARYTRAHIRRRLVYVLLGLDRWEVLGAMRGGVPYARVLGFTQKGREILKRHSENVRGHSGIRVITRLAEAQGRIGKYFADVEYRASQLYELTQKKPDFQRETQKPVLSLLMSSAKDS